MKRRTYLTKAAATSTLFLSGCVGGNSGDNSVRTTTITTSSSGTDVSTLALGTRTPSGVGQEKFPDYEWKQLRFEDPLATTSIWMRFNSFNPLIAAVTPNTDISFINQDGSPHTITIPALNIDRTVKSKQKTTIAFKKLGKYDYVCTNHPPAMLGRVVVTDDPPNKTATPPE